MPDEPERVTVSPVREVRLMRPAERPNDVVLEVVTTAGTKQYFLLPEASLLTLAQKLVGFVRLRTGPGSNA